MNSELQLQLAPPLTARTASHTEMRSVLLTAVLAALAMPPSVFMLTSAPEPGPERTVDGHLLRSARQLQGSINASIAVGPLCTTRHCPPYPLCPRPLPTAHCPLPTANCQLPQ